MNNTYLPEHYINTPLGVSSSPRIVVGRDWNRKKISQTMKTTMGGEAKIEVVDRKGNSVPFRFGNRIVKETPWIHNLITNVGMNRIGSGTNLNFHTTSVGGMLHRCIAGTGSAEDKTDSGAVTASQSGTTVTLSGSLGAVQAGRVIKWDSGETAFLVSGDGTTWTAKEDQTVTSDEFTVFHTNRATMENGTKIAVTESVVGSASLDGWTRNTRRYDFAEETSNQNYNEIGFCTDDSLEADIASRIVLGSSVSVLEGQVLRVTLQWTCFATPMTSRASSLTISGWDTGSITEQIVGVHRTVQPAGVTGGKNDYLPVAALNTSMLMGLHKNTTHPTPISSGTTVFPNSSNDWMSDNTLGSIEAYTENSFFRDENHMFGANDAVSTGFRGLIFQIANSFRAPAIACVWENPVDKADTHTLSIKIRKSWDRVYV